METAPTPNSPNSNLINEINALKEKINTLTERMISLENKLEKLESTKKNNYGLTDKIIKTEEEIKELFSFISNGRERQFRLLFSPTLENNKKEDFHKNCDNKGSTIILVETSNGRRFGTFASLSWKSNNQWVNVLLLVFIVLIIIKDIIYYFLNMPILEALDMVLILEQETN